MADSITSEGDLAGLKADPQEKIANLCTDLGDFEDLAGQISGLKADTLEKEVQILSEIITRITPLLVIIGRTGESYYRRDLIILNKQEVIPQFVGRSSRFFSVHQLVLYETGALFDLHHFGEITGDEVRPGWQLDEETELSAEAAVSYFGLPAIAEGLIKIFQGAHETTILKSELEDRLAVLVKVLEALH
jgi:hypothetical protein